MPAVICKSASATNGIVCISQTSNVSDDGLISVRARFLLRTEADASLFELDLPWPSGSAPRGLPRNQGGPYLVNRDFEYANGLVFVNATYVTATNPVRVVYSEQKATRAFSGLIVVRDPNNPQQTTVVNVKMDYTSTVASARYTLMLGQTFRPDLSAAKINTITGASQQLVSLILKKNIDSEDRSILGRVVQVTKSREVVFYSE